MKWIKQNKSKKGGVYASRQCVVNLDDLVRPHLEWNGRRHPVLDIYPVLAMNSAQKRDFNRPIRLYTLTKKLSRTFSPKKLTLTFSYFLSLTFSYFLGTFSNFFRPSSTFLYLPQPSPTFWTFWERTLGDPGTPGNRTKRCVKFLFFILTKM